MVDKQQAFIEVFLSKVGFWKRFEYCKKFFLVDYFNCFVQSSKNSIFYDCNISIIILYLNYINKQQAFIEVFLSKVGFWKPFSSSSIPGTLSKIKMKLI